MPGASPTAKSAPKFIEGATPIKLAGAAGVILRDLQVRGVAVRVSIGRCRGRKVVVEMRWCRGGGGHRPLPRPAPLSLGGLTPIKAGGMAAVVARELQVRGAVRLHGQAASGVAKR